MVGIDWRTCLVISTHMYFSSLYGSECEAFGFSLNIGIGGKTLADSNEQNCRELSLGMQNNVIPDDKITASSGKAGDQARLNDTNGPWCAMGNDARPYLQIDLGTPHIICAVSTQGDHLGEKWVKAFHLSYSDNGKTYHPYTEKGNAQQTFYGNVDGSGIVKQILYQGIIARYLRILPMMHHRAVCMKAEIHGVQIQSASRVNYAYHKTATQSSVSWGGKAGRAVDGNRNPNYFNGSCSHTGSEWEPWWMVDLGQMISVYEVYIVNRGYVAGINRLQNFQIHIGENGQNGGSSNPLCGGVYTIPIGQGRSIFCAPIMVGRYLTIKLKGRIGSFSLCEVEVYTQDNLGLAIGISNSSLVPDNRLSASTIYSNTRSAAKARLLGNGSWRPRDNDPSPWLQIDFGKIYYVCALATQGDPNSDERTIKYKVKGCACKDSQWTTMESGTGGLVFTASIDPSKVIKHILPSPLSARLIRFYPIEKKRAHALRVEVYGVIKKPALPRPSPIGDKVLEGNQGSHVELVCRADKGVKIKWYHNDTDITSYSSGTVKTGSTLKSTLRVNYTSADDVYDKYSCDEVERQCKSLDYICQVDYGLYRKLQSRGSIVVVEVGMRIGKYWVQFLGFM